ncbi:CgeB family protein [Ancylobacter lacus]|uniref:CgeB family protein n=1 Tax=Ancylobacter lacus TaxID=2579970 RepID=UPI001BD0A970|nr:glycosyltransferase [Ancylobacter lacus]MBS7538412.1 glycosyltransferase [Ancylobacter lacus]
MAAPAGGRLSIVVLGLSLSSSWGNGHATTWRALLKALAGRGHDILFLERDRPWYAEHRDLPTPDFCTLRLYDEVEDLAVHAGAIAGADLVIVGSFVPDGIAVGRFVQEQASGLTAFYDIDTPVTLARLEREAGEYVSADLIPGFDLYLSFTGGPTLERLMRDFGAPAARALYCSVDEKVYRPLDAAARGATTYDLGYLGTYSADRQPTLEALLIEPARRRPDLSFVVAGPLYPPDLAWPANVARIDHLPPDRHPAFYNACRFTLNVTRADMIRAGHSPSVRLFEAAACGTPIVSDIWAGLDTLFRPGREILLAQGTEDVLAALDLTEEARRRLGAAGRGRILESHTAAHRAAELERHVAEAGEARRHGRVRAAAGRAAPDTQDRGIAP